ncbi:MAG: DUF1800 domain-containing protein [Saprospiraceae bacterium]|nr:DUF1800 domain-containing protein [Saprospiraceae bacterium]
MPDPVTLTAIRPPFPVMPPGHPLDPYVPSAAKPWNARRVALLYLRLGFGATLDLIQQGLQMSPADLVDQLLDGAANLDLPAPFYWSGWTAAQYEADPDPDIRFAHRDELRRSWFNSMLDEGVRAKFALFWHNHFVTELDTYDCNAYLWQYFTMLHEHAFGNFRTFVREMGKSPAMLVYLNGNLNVAGEPNENYARELMELFTMGESNGYTQADIVEMARAMTGWQVDMYECTPPYYAANLHDNGSKTIFGQASNYTFTSAHNLIFTLRAEQVSRFIPGKIYKNFVYQTPDNQVIEGLATTFKDGNWEIMPMLKQLFKSEHFFEERNLSARLKNPIESMVPIFKMAGATSADIENDWWDAIGYWSYELGQEVFNPSNVAGWPGHRKWINESTLTTRWSYSSGTVYLLTESETLRENLRSLAQTLTNDSQNPLLVTLVLAEFFLGQDLEPIHQQAAVNYFKSGIPENYYQDGSWSLYWDEAPYQIANLLYYLVRLPEFQLT